MIMFDMLKAIGLCTWKIKPRSQNLCFGQLHSAHQNSFTLTKFAGLIVGTIRMGPVQTIRFDNF